MKLKHIFLYTISLFSIFFLQAQEVEEKESVVKTKQYKLFIGGDLISPLSSVWDKSNGYEFNANMRLYNKIHGVIEVGSQENNYSKVNWDIDIDGTYYKIGANWSFNQSDDNEDDFFYAGIRYGFTSYDQNIKAYPIITTTTGTTSITRISQSTTGLGSDTLSASWFEFVLGARKELWATNFYLDTSIRPKVLISSEEQNGVESFIIPGFGDVINNSNLWLNVSLNYRVPLFKKEIKGK